MSKNIKTLKIQKEKIKIKASIKLAGIFSSLTLLIVGTTSLLNVMIIDFNSVFFACKIALSGAVFAGICGYAIGKIIETVDLSKQNKTHNLQNDKKSDVLIDKVLVDDMANLDE